MAKKHTTEALTVAEKPMQDMTFVVKLSNTCNTMA
jgi:hypothetical protein